MIPRLWEATAASSHFKDVPPNEWGWCFDLKMGTPRVLLQAFEHERNTKGKSVTRTTIGPRENPHNYPLLTFDKVKAIYDQSQEQQVSHRKLFLKHFDRKKLSDEQIELLATAPDIYTAGPQEFEVKAADAERAKKAQVFLDEVDAIAKPAKVKAAAG